MSTDDGFLQNVIALLSRALVPLSLAASSPDELASLLTRLGWPASSGSEVAAQITDVASAIDRLADDVEAGAGTAALMTDVSNVFAEFVALRNVSLDPSVGAPFNDPEFWQQLPDDFLGLLVSEALEVNAQGLYGVLSFLGVFRKRSLIADSSSGRGAYVSRTIDWTTLSRIVASPTTWMSDVYGWGVNFDHTGFLSSLAALGAGINSMVSLSPPHSALFSPFITDNNPDRGQMKQLVMSPFILGGLTPTLIVKPALIVTALPPAGSPSLPPEGLLLSPVVTGAAQASIDLPGNTMLSLVGDFQASPVQVGLRPDGVTLESAQANIDVAAYIDIAPTTTVLLGGVSNGTRFEFSRAHIGFELQGTATDLDFVIDVGLDEANAILDLGNSDSFLRGVLGVGPYLFSLPVGFTWSKGAGLQFSGNSMPEIRISVNLVLAGLLTITEIEVSLSSSETDDAVTIRAAITGSLNLDPFFVSFYGLGVDVKTRTTSLDAPGNFGLLDLTFGVKSPDGIGFEFEAGAVHGSGLLVVDNDRYIGGLSLDVINIGIDAFTIIDTSLPGNPDGYALFATLTLRFPSIPLGFGFTLSGLGGILALNRSVDAEALAFGLRDGAADAVLFPEDPLRDAELLVSQLDEYFPIREGNTVVGPVAEIGWGAPTIITGQLGVVVSLPEGVIVVLGSIEAILPDPGAPILELHLDTLGAINLAAGTLLVVASLYDSRLLGVIELSGDAAMYVSFVNNPYFLLSVGGFHPGFQPPAHVPSVLESLRVMRAEVVIGLGVTALIENYFAVTSNTVQFGGGFEIEASATFLLVTYTARGWFEFDVLIRFSPFLIMADASAGVGVYANNKELLGVNLSVHLEGPDPWYANGNASFKFFGIKVKFDFAVGGHAPPMIQPTSDVLNLIQVELMNPVAWTTERGSGLTAGLLLTNDDSSSVLIRPDDVLVARQTVAPLDYHLARFGETTPLQDEVSVTSTSIVDSINGEDLGNLHVEDITDWFAPAQYTVMNDQTRLSAPSYEQMTAGISIGASGVGLPQGDRINAPAGHETEVWQPDTGHSMQFDNVIAIRETVDMIASSVGGRVASTLQGATVDVSRITVGTQSYVAVDSLSGEATSEVLSYADAVISIGDIPGGRVVPLHAGRPS